MVVGNFSPLFDSSASLQAQELKSAMEEVLPKRAEYSCRKTKSIAVVSGKGGVGKSNFALNLALLLGDKFDKPTTLLDADIGMANLDVLLGLNARLNLSHVLNGELKLREVILPISKKVWFLPGGSGISRLNEVDWEMCPDWIDEISMFDERVDIIIADTGAGISRDVLFFAMASDTIILVTTPEPTALKDAYGLLKSLIVLYGRQTLLEKELLFVVNMARSKQEAFAAADRLMKVSAKFLNIKPRYIGYLPFDIRVADAVKSKCPIVKMHPKSPIVRSMETIAKRILGLSEGGASEAFAKRNLSLGVFQRLFQRLKGV